eukprot:scaffold40685_cov208-Isochrysis_galbana.AAC.1
MRETWRNTDIAFGRLRRVVAVLQPAGGGEAPEVARLQPHEQTPTRSYRGATPCRRPDFGWTQGSAP